MDILQVEAPLVCTRRVAGLQQISLRILRDNKGKQHVAVHPVGLPEGNWVFTQSGTAARKAAGNYEIQTDLTNGGIIDYWEVEDNQPTAKSEATAQTM